MIQTVHMFGRFENPILSAGQTTAGTSKSASAKRRRDQDFLREEGLVSRDAASYDELLGQHCITMDSDTFMWSRCAYRIHDIGKRRQAAKPPQTSLGLPYSRIDVAAYIVSSRNGKHHFPNPGSSVLPDPQPSIRAGKWNRFAASR